MLDRNDLRAFRLFNKKAEKLKNNSFTKKIIDEGFGLSLSFKKDYPLNIETRFPNDESIESFVLTIRFFCQNNEPSSLSRIAEIYSKLPDYRSEKSACLDERKKLNDYLDSYDNSLNIKINDKRFTNKRFTNREIFAIFLYGGLAHAEKHKEEIYDIWMTNELLHPIFQNEFIKILTKLLSSISYIQKLNDSLM